MRSASSTRQAAGEQTARGKQQESKQQQQSQLGGPPLAQNQATRWGAACSPRASSARSHSASRRPGRD
eukprot:15002110-Alexandrium_andersonii.AAC.1